MKTKLPLLLVASFALAFVGCVASGPGSASISGRADVVIGADDYDYYPGSEVYYSPAHHNYYYRDGNSWVRRNDPPRAWAREAPSVRMHFNDAPDRHHAEVARQYPRTWHPANNGNARVANPPENHDHDHDHDADRDRH